MDTIPFVKREKGTQLPDANQNGKDNVNPKYVKD